MTIFFKVTVRGLFLGVKKRMNGKNGAGLVNNSYKSCLSAVMMAAVIDCCCILYQW